MQGYFDTPSPSDIESEIEDLDTSSEEDEPAPLPPPLTIDEVVVRYRARMNLLNINRRNLRVLNLNIKGAWMDMAMAGTRTEEAREVKDYYTSRLAGRTFDVIKFSNGYTNDRFGNPPRVQWAAWLGMQIVNSYRVVATDGTVYDSPEPHYLIHYVKL